MWLLFLMWIHRQSPSTQEAPSIQPCFGESVSFMPVSRAHQSEFTSQMYWQSQREAHHHCWTRVLGGVCVSFLAAPRRNLLPRSLVFFHLHSGSRCFVTLHFLSWLYLEAGLIAETLAGQKVGNKFLFHLSGNLSSPEVWGHAGRFSPGWNTNSYV